MESFKQIEAPFDGIVTSATPISAR